MNAKSDCSAVSGDGREGMPLRAVVQDGNLVVSIGIRTLAWAFEHGEGNNPYDESLGDFKREYQIADPIQFAEDVCHELNDEGEDGSTPLTRFLDSIMDKAVENGSLGILDPEDDEPHATNPDGVDGDVAKPHQNPNSQNVSTASSPSSKAPHKARACLLPQQDISDPPR